MGDAGQMIDVLDSLEGLQETCPIQYRALHELGSGRGFAGFGLIEDADEIAASRQGGNQVPPMNPLPPVTKICAMPCPLLLVQMLFCYSMDGAGSVRMMRTPWAAIDGIAHA